jgi:hypothetical protein
MFFINLKTCNFTLLSKLIIFMENRATLKCLAGRTLPRPDLGSDSQPVIRQIWNNSPFIDVLLHRVPKTVSWGAAEIF